MPTSCSVPGLEREELVELAQDPDVARALHRTPADAALQIGQHAIVGAAQAASRARRTASTAEPSSAEHEEVQRAVDGDQAQHEPVAQGLAAQGDLDLVALGRNRGPAARRSGSATQLSQRRQRCQRSAPRSRTRSRVLGAEVRASSPDQVMAAQAAGDQLPIDLAPRRGGGWVPGGRA